MPIDTTEKKLSLMNMGLPWITTLPYADGSLDQGDEQHLLNLYSGILAETVAPPPVIDIVRTHSIVRSVTRTHSIVRSVTRTHSMS